MNEQTSAPAQTAKITLYWLDKSRAHRVLWLLEELGVEYELKTYKRRSDMRAPKELKDVHPLGKSPVISVQGPEGPPRVIAETGLIVEYLIDHFGKGMEPMRYPPGKEGQVGGETEEWLRNRYFMHYAEGTLMPFLVMTLVFGQLKGPMVPWIVRPITRAIANQVEASFLDPNLHSNYDFLEAQISTAPENGQFLCGPKLTGADIMMIFPLDAAGGAGLTAEKYPKLTAYIQRLQEREAYTKAVKKVEDITGEKFSVI